MEAARDSSSQFKRLLECAICLEQFKDPRMLKCQHTFCFSCLGPMPGENNRITCPVCRGQTTLPDGGLADLPPSILAGGILETLCPFCGVNIKNQTCPHCKEKVCQPCKTAHLKELKESVEQFLADRNVNPTPNDVGPTPGPLIDDLRAEAETCLQRVLQNCADILKERGNNLRSELEEKLEELEPRYSEHVMNCNQLTRQQQAQAQEMRAKLAGDQLSDEDIIRMFNNCEEMKKIKNQSQVFDSRVQVLIDEDALYSSLRQMGTVSLVTEHEGIDHESDQPDATDVGSQGRAPVVVDYRSMGTPRQVVHTRGSGRGQLCNPARVTVSPLNGDILVADTGNNRIQIFDKDHKHRMIIGRAGKGEGQFSGPKGVVVLADGSIAVADVGNNRVQVFSGTGQYRYMFGSEGHLPGQFHGPITLATDQAGLLYVCDWDNHRVQVFTAAGALVSAIGSYGTGPGQFNHPGFVTVNKHGEVIISDTWNNRVQVFSSDGTHKLIIGGSGNGPGTFYSPLGLVTDDDCNVIVSDFGNNRIQVFNQQGEFLSYFGSPGFGEGQFNRPAGLALTREGHLVVCDYSNHRLQIF